MVWRKPLTRFSSDIPRAESPKEKGKKVENPRLPEFDENSPIRPARFGHIVLQTSRFEEMANWYKSVLNAEPMFEIEGRGSFLTFDDEHHRVLIIKNPNVTPREPTAEGVAHWAYLFDSLTDLMTTYARLRDLGITQTNCVNLGFKFSLYNNHPYRNQVELR